MELNYTSAEKESESLLTIKSVRVGGDDKSDALMLLLGKTDAHSTLVFCNHREAVNRISEQLTRCKVEHGVYHGGMEQPERERMLIKFRNGSVNILITTDLAARGLDIPEVDAIIHYQLPNTEEVMIHRNGRTARMHASGTAYFLLGADDYLPKFLSAVPEEVTLPKSCPLPNPVNGKHYI